METPLGRDGLVRALGAALAAPAGADGALLTGLAGPARSLAVASLLAGRDAKALLVVADERRAAEAAVELGTFLASAGDERAVLALPPLEVDPYRGLSPHLEIAAERARALAALVEPGPVVVVAPVSALLVRTVRPELLAGALLELRTGETVELDALVRWLVETGYVHEDPVGSPGEFARRGGIVDVFPPDRDAPIRIELWGDVIEEIRAFDPDSQRATGPVSPVRLYPAREWVCRDEHRRALRERWAALGVEDDPLVELVDTEPFPRGLPFALPRLDDFRASVLDYLGAGVLFVEEPADVLRRASSEWERILDSYADLAAERRLAAAEPAELLVPLERLDEAARRAVRLEELDVLGAGAERRRHVATQLLPSFRGRIADFVAEVRRQRDEGRRVHVFCGQRGLAERLVEIFQEAGLSAGSVEERALPPGTVALHRGTLTRGFVLPELGEAVFTGRDIFDEPARPPRGRSRRLGRFLSDFRDLKVGDYVVHTDHGIGVFVGLQQMAPESGSSEFVVLEYHGGDRLYVPVEKLDRLEKYSSAEGARPRVDRLGGTSWARVTRRVRKSVRDMAQELLRLYAARKGLPGHAFGPDTHWQKEFEDLFEYEETPDQAQAIEEVKRDMESPFPMDRLLCGDVGYGKTEVAMRAAFKAVMDGKQVAVLVPTTVLAYQHFGTFRARFAPFPVRIEMLSRFRTPRERKAILRDLESGLVDIVIGTHRLLSKDVVFKDLGLLVVDEEQRFGVAHKERLKHLKKNVDCLTMTATPIPRTLHMSLSGIRDLSVIETPPKDRMAIQTYLTRLDGKILAEAIRHELARDGQVYFVHNRVSSIHSMAAYLARLVPEARIGIAHGQMKESDLERTMLRFVRGELDVLVTTTIIENGLDIPRVNTLIVHRADRFGLAQLYQLRGRVGRSSRRAYAYLVVPDERTLSPVARRRLAAIREFSDLGSGFRIAALDLELRGAGNLLGGEQHGHIEAVGFDLYCRLLDEAVRELSGEEAEPARATLSLRIDLRIPDEYIPDINQRMAVYKRASGARDETSIDRLAEEIRDRYGPLPDSVLQLLELVRLRLLAESVRVVSIEREGGVLAFRFGETAPVEPARLVRLAGAWPGARLRPSGVLQLPLDGPDVPELLSTVREVLLALRPYSKMAERSAAPEGARR